MTPPTDLHDDTGQRIVLGHRLGAGGEAEVFAFAHDAGCVAKIYLSPTDQTKVGKLHAMVADPHKELRQYCAWPMSSLRDQNNKLVGFVMPRIPPAFREIHELFSPLDRLQHFPQVGFNFLVHAAINLASAVDAVHEAGHVIGDVNQKNVMVDPQAFVRLVDADSFQIWLIRCFGEVCSRVGKGVTSSGEHTAGSCVNSRGDLSRGVRDGTCSSAVD